MQEESYDIDDSEQFKVFIKTISTNRKVRESNLTLSNYFFQLIFSFREGGTLLLYVGISIIAINLSIIFGNSIVFILVICIVIYGATFLEGLMHPEYSSLCKYLLSKSKLQKIDTEMTKILIGTMANRTFDNLKLEEISMLITDIGKMYTTTYKLMKAFNRIKKILDDDNKKLLDKFLIHEINWLMDYASKFKGFLKLWLSDHTQKVSKITFSMMECDHKSIELAFTRLSSHIENLEKVRARL